LQDELINIQRKQKLTIIFVTHDVQEAAYLGDTILIMKSGSIHTAIPVPHEHPRQRGSQELAQIEKITLEKLQKT
ncbi:MAG: ABC transporter ATP-binding protein, partial [Spirochaetaceae bacterium]